MAKAFLIYVTNMVLAVELILIKFLTFYIANYSPKILDITENKCIHQFITLRPSGINTSHFFEIWLPLLILRLLCILCCF